MKENRGDDFSMRFYRYLFLFLLLTVSGFAQEYSVLLPEPKLTLLSGRHEEDCIAIGSLGMYAIEKQNIRRIHTGCQFIHEPTPILSSNRDYICALAKKGKNPAVAVIYELGWRRATEIILPQTPTAWAAIPAAEKVILATGTGFCELRIGYSDIFPVTFELTESIEGISASPSGNHLFVSTQSNGYILRTDAYAITDKFPLSSGILPSESLWIDATRFACITGVGEPDRFVDLYEISEEGLLKNRVPSRLASSGTPGQYEHLAISDYGNFLALGMVVQTPSDFFPAELNPYPKQIVQIKDLTSGQNPLSQKPTWPQFAWASKTGHYAYLAERFAGQPGNEIPSSAKPSDWALYVQNTQTGDSRTPPTPLYVSKVPLTQVCWSQDGSLVYAISWPSPRTPSVLCFQIQ